MMTLFTDIDNTMIYSKRRVKSLDNMSCVEVYNSEPLSYMLNSTKEGLIKLGKTIKIVPITTRVDYQYKRIDLPNFEYVLINNGGVLLTNGVVDKEWLNESYNLVKKCKNELLRVYNLLDSIPSIELLRLPDNMFVFAKSDDIDLIYDYIISEADTSQVYIFKQGKKLYIMPFGMDKGSSIRRFKNRFDCGNVYSAGDEILDFSMADESINFLTSNASCNKENCIKFKNQIFSDCIINYMMSLK